MSARKRAHCPNCDSLTINWKQKEENGNVTNVDGKASSPYSDHRTLGRYPNRTTPIG